MSWDVVTLSNVCDVRDGTHDSPKFVDNGYPLVTSRNIVNGKLDFRNVNYISKADYTQINKRSKVDLGDIIMPMIGTIGNPHLVAEQPAFAIKNVALFKIDTSRLSSNFFYMLLISSAVRNQLTNSSRGGTQKFVSLKNLRSLKIPLPPLPTQKKIVEILDCAQGLIDTRKKQITQMDQLVQSLFYDMFGDPVKNPKGWEGKKLGDCLTTIDSGWSPKCLSTPARNGFWGVLKLSAVTGGYFSPSENKELPADLRPKKQNEVKKKDLLFTRKNTAELVGSCAYVYETPAKLLMPDIIFRLVTREQVVKLFLWGLLNSSKFRGNIVVLAGGSAASMINISKAKLNSLEIPVPPITLQYNFAARVEEIEAQKAQMTDSLKELEDNFNSLMQRAFKGELV